MPYATNADLSPPVRRSLPAHSLDKFVDLAREVFANAVDPLDLQEVGHTVEQRGNVGVVNSHRVFMDHAPAAGFAADQVWRAAIRVRPELDDTRSMPLFGGHNVP